MFYAVTRLWQSVRTHHDRARAIRELNAMDDYQLADLGIERHQIADYVHGRVARPSGGTVRTTAQHVFVSNTATINTAATGLRHAA